MTLMKFEINSLMRRYYLLVQSVLQEDHVTRAEDDSAVAVVVRVVDKAIDVADHAYVVVVVAHSSHSDCFVLVLYNNSIGT